MIYLKYLQDEHEGIDKTRFEINFTSKNIGLTISKNGNKMATQCL